MQKIRIINWKLCLIYIAYLFNKLVIFPIRMVTFFKYSVGYMVIIIQNSELLYLHKFIFCRSELYN